MSHNNETLQTNFHNAIREFTKPVYASINEKLVTYYNQLSKTETDKDAIFIKILQKSNELILNESIIIASIFDNISDEAKKVFIQSLKKSSDQ